MDKLGRGTRKIIWNHVLGMAVALFSILVFTFAGNTTLNLILGSIITFIYILIMYSGGWNMGLLDSRRTADTMHNDVAYVKYLHGESPKLRLKRVIIASLLATIPTLILLGVVLAAPIIFGNTSITIGYSEIEGAGEYVYEQVYVYGYGYQYKYIYHPVLEPVKIAVAGFTNLIYVFWMPPALAFFQVFGGNFNSGINILYILPIFIIPIFVPLGYIVGRTRFSIIEKVFPKIIYKKRAAKKDLNSKERK